MNRVDELTLLALDIQGTGNKKWYSAGVGWVDFGHNSGTLQLGCPLIKNTVLVYCDGEALLKLHPLPYCPQPQRLTICSDYHHR